MILHEKLSKNARKRAARRATGARERLCVFVYFIYGLAPSDASAAKGGVSDSGETGRIGRAASASGRSFFPARQYFFEPAYT
jgi:hypothetical protein